MTTSDFEFGEILGEGAYGAVVRATEKATGRMMAIKMIQKKHLDKEQKRQSAKTERDILSMCDHPLIIKLYTTFQDPGYLYYGMELAPNGELHGLVRKLGGLSVESAAFYAAEIVLALEYLHTVKGVIHRDLKPENVLLSETGHIKLTDFGTSKVVGVARDARSNSFVGTAEYIGPEMLQGDNRVAYKSMDLWSLGCMIFQMICGRPPFRGATEYVIFQKVTAGKITFPTNMPEVAKDLIIKLCVIDPFGRLGSASFSDLKAHPFFSTINWTNLLEQKPIQESYPVKDKLVWEEDVIREEEERQKLIREQERQEWASFLLDTEKILVSGLIYKRRKLSIKKRFMILTDTPRLFYIDPKTRELKGEVPWSRKLTCEVKNDVTWRVNTPKRVYFLEDISKNAGRWLEAIKKLQDAGK